MTRSSRTSKPSMPPALDSRNPPPLDRYCDLVLKGGVVDGVVYPGALLELARHYRFQGIAGTSVGAVAAAIAAACEFSRRHGSNVGFDEVLREIPNELAKEASWHPGRTLLRSIFLPRKDVEHLFGFVVSLLSTLKQPSNWVGTLLDAISRHYSGIFLPVFLGFVSCAFFLQAFRFSVLVSANHDFFLLNLQALCIGLPVGALLGALAVIWTMIREFLVLTKTPGWGFCDGMSTEPGVSEGFTEWMHKGIQGAARQPLGRPLTFKDLWEAPGGPRRSDGTAEARSIDLRMMATAVSHGRPYEFPQADNSVRLFFKLEEFEAYFPASVCRHLESVTTPYAPGDAVFFNGNKLLKEPSMLDPNASSVRELPIAELPVLVACRLSMSVPILFQAVPLWAIDLEAIRPAGLFRDGKPLPEGPSFRKVWFVDGGITSNFPIHFFDAPVPSWPTFGIAVGKFNRAEFYKAVATEDSMVQLTEFHSTGHHERWSLGAEDQDMQSFRKARGTGFYDFLFNMAATAQDWPENAALRMPGTRDRVATVFKQGFAESGLNLNIHGDDILGLAYVRGVRAGRLLARKFCTDAIARQPTLRGTSGWLDHRWVRFNSYLGALTEHLAKFAVSVGRVNGVSTIRQQIESAKTVAPLRSDVVPEPCLTDAQAQALLEAVAAMERLERALELSASVVQPFSPVPQVVVQSVPKL